VTRIRWDAVIVGAGTVGLLTALAASRRGRVLVVTNRKARAAGALPAEGDFRFAAEGVSSAQCPRSRGYGSRSRAPRIDAVPVSFLALLVEFGVHPAEIGSDSVHTPGLSPGERAL
jgi:hypothetical protein